MIYKKFIANAWWDYDDRINRYYNPYTMKWVLNPTKPRKGLFKGMTIGKSKGKSVGKNKGKSISDSPTDDFHYYDFGIKMSDSIEENERVQLFLSKVLIKYRIHLYRKGNDILFDKDLNDYNVDVYSHFTINDIKTLLGTRYNIRLDWLLSNNYVKKTYIKTQFNNYLYTFIPLPKLLELKAKTISVKTLRVWNSLMVYYKKKEKALGELSYLFDITSKYNIKITKEQFNEVLKERYNDYKKEKEYNKQNYYNLDEYIEYNQYIYQNILHYNSITRYERLDYYSKDKFSGRFHSIFTSIPKQIRQNYITDIDRSIDLKQSQPTLLSKILKDEIGDNNFTTGVENNDLYLTMMNKNNIPNRELAKEYMFSILFGKIWLTNSKGQSFINPKHEQFRRLYPKAASYIEKLKTTPNKLKKTHSILALILQQTELKIFRQIWEILKDKKIKFIPIHDEILCSNKDFDIVNKTIIEVLNKELNIKYELNYIKNI